MVFVVPFGAVIGQILGKDTKSTVIGAATGANLRARTPASQISAFLLLLANAIAFTTVGFGTLGERMVFQLAQHMFVGGSPRRRVPVPVDRAGRAARVRRSVRGLELMGAGY